MWRIFQKDSFWATIKDSFVPCMLNMLISVLYASQITAISNMFTVQAICNICINKHLNNTSFQIIGYLTFWPQVWPLVLLKKLCKFSLLGLDLKLILIANVKFQVLNYFFSIMCLSTRFSKKKRELQQHNIKRVLKAQSYKIQRATWCLREKKIHTTPHQKRPND